MQQKQAKIKKMRRAWAKPYGRKRLPPDNNNFGYVQVSKDDDGQPIREFVSMSMGSRNKAANSKIDLWLLTRFRDNQIDHPDKIRATVEDNAGQKHLVLYRVMQSMNNAGSLSGAERLHRIKLMDGPTWKLELHFGRDIAFFVEWKKEPTKEVHKRSIMYTGKRRAMDVFSHDYNKITWTEVKHSLPKPTEVPTG